MDTEKLKAIALSIRASIGTPAEAVEFADVVALATPWTALPEAVDQIGKPAKRKILWDCTNALKPDMRGLLIGTTTSGGGEVAKLAPWARVVKAIPPFAELLHSSSVVVERTRPTVFVCGNDLDARAVVSGLVEDIAALPVDAGPLSAARFTEPAGMLLVHPAYRQAFGPRIGLALARDTTGVAQSGTSGV